MIQNDILMEMSVVDRKILAGFLIIVAISGTGIAAILLNVSTPYQIPPPSTPPGNEIQITTAGQMDVWAEATYTQNYMPSVPPEGPPFYSFISINITNNGNVRVSGISAFRITIYYNDTLNPLVTLNLTSAVVYIQPINVGPGESIVVDFINIRNEIYSPTIDEGTGLYGRILFTWENGQEVILTTIPTALLFTY